MLKSVNQKVSIFLFLLAGVYLFLSYQLPSYPYTAIDADVIPKSLGWLLVLLSISLFLSKDQETEEQKKKRDIPKAEWLMLTGVFGLVFLYIFLLEIIGFVLVTGLFIYFCSLFLGYRKNVSNVLVSILFPVGLYIIFNFLLKIELPQGILPI
ncbi:tripartite tricarboxylate transporter TctB family protein [Bacillaceae bacterium S4-13-56]